MLTPILKTKLHIPSPRANGVRRLHLIKQLNEGLHRKLTLISAPAGFGKTTLVSEWVAECKRPTAWVSLDEGDNDLPRFLTYLVTALQTIAVKIGEGLLGTLQSPQLPPIELILTTLLNELTTIRDNFVLVLDDYHVVDSKSIDNGLSFLLEHLPPQIHLVIVTREDPNISLARLRAQGHLTELRATSLRFNPSEAAEFFNQVMGLDLAEEEISALETRTEGWIAGLQLAAISMQGHKDTAGFIKSFTGSHHFVMDYLVEEVLRQQPDSVQTFLLHTSILDRLCGPLCDAVLLDPSVSGKETLENLELANIFIIPLDNERCWYRYHHLFADLLRQRLHQSTASSLENGMKDTTELHKRASYWYEHNGLENEAFQHAVAANDVEQAARLVEGEGVPLHYRSTIAPVLNWLISLPATVLDARPSLWVMYASALAMNGQLTSVEPKLQAAESALRSFKPDDKTSNLVGHIAAIRATLASMQNQADSIIFQARRALKYLHPDNLAVRTVPSWALGYAYQLQGNRSAAIQAYSEAILNSQAVGYNMITIMAMTGLASIQESENQLFLAAESYQRVLQLVGDPPMSTACEAHLGLARISYEWNDMDAAKRHAEQSIQLGRQVENLDTPAAGEILLARLKINKGDVNGATALLKSAGQFAHRHDFILQINDIAVVHVLMLLRQGNLTAAADLAEKQKLPFSQARVHIAKGDTSKALAVLEQLRQQAETSGWEDERLKSMILQALALYAHGETDKATKLLGGTLAMAEPASFIRIFIDEGTPMAQLLSETADRGIMQSYIGKLLHAFEIEEHTSQIKPDSPIAVTDQPLTEPLSKRELEVLQLIAQGLSNSEICERLFLALDTVKGHNRNIFGKLQVQRRTEAVAHARELGLL